MLPAIPAQMATRAGLDASHASKSVTAWREKNLAIKVNLTEFAEVRFSLRLIARVVCTFDVIPLAI